MKRYNDFLLLAVLVGMSWLGAPLQANAAETGMVAEVFACQFNDGKTMDDVNSATEHFVEQIAALGNPALAAMNAYVWTPVIANTEFDLLWFSVHDNLNAFGAATDALAGEVGQAVQARYDEAGDCMASLLTLTPIYTSEQVAFDGATVIEAYRCRLNPGASLADVEPVLEEWRGVLSELGGYDNTVAFMMTPLASNAPFDLYYFGVHDSNAAYADRRTRMLTSDSGRANQQRFAELHWCESSIWSGRQTIAGAE